MCKKTKTFTKTASNFVLRSINKTNVRKKWLQMASNIRHSVEKKFKIKKLIAHRIIKQKFCSSPENSRNSLVDLQSHKDSKKQTTNKLIFIECEEVKF